MAARSDARADSPREIVVSRVLDAPPALVFEMWTKAEHLTAWWGPNGFTLPSCELDFRVGGAYCFLMRGPDGEDRWLRGSFREIVEDRRLVFTFAWGDRERTTGPDTLVTVTFEPVQGERGKTRLTLRQAGLESAEAASSHDQGWTETIARLATHAANRTLHAS
jgi:uncharacterized protein YndB with AHSA1/START domain